MNFGLGRAAVLGLVLACSGCSYIFVTGKPANVEALPPSEPITCTTSKVTPILDTVFAGLEVARTAYAVSLSDGDYSGQPLNRGADIGIGASLVALFASSAIYGYLVTGSCADAKSQHERQRQQYLYPAGPPPVEFPAQSAPPAPQPASPAPQPASPAPQPASPAPSASVPSSAFPPAP